MPETTIVNIKSMPVEAWALAKSEAGKADQSMAEWLSAAIYLKAQHDAEGRFSPAAAPVIQASAKPPALSPEQVEALARALALSTDSAGIPAPKVAARHIAALVTQHARAARGLAEPAPRRKVVRGEVGLAAIPYDNFSAENG